MLVHLDGVKPVESSPYPIFPKLTQIHHFQSPNPTLDRSEEKIGRHSLRGAMRRIRRKRRQRRQLDGSRVRAVSAQP
jgi:hypothetical protein